MIKYGLASLLLALSATIVALPETSIMEQKAKMIEELSKEFSKPAPVLIDKDGKLLKKPAAKRSVSLENEIELQPVPTRSHKFCSKNACCDIASRLTALQATANTILNNTIEILAAVACANATPIFAADVNPNGYLITVPGVYCLPEDIPFNPAIPGLSAIIVDTDNVVILGHNHHLFQNNDQADVNGILVNGRSSVIITDVNVTDFDLYGIRLNPGSSYVSLNKVSALRNGAEGQVGGGILLSSSPGVETHDVILNEVEASENLFIGLTIAGANNIIVKNSTFDANTGNSFIPAIGGFSSWGVFAAPLFTGDPCHDLTFIDSQANNNEALGGAIGFEILSVPAFALPVNIDVSFIRCIANNNQGGGEADVVNEGEGFVIAGTQNFIVEDCQAYSNQSLAPAPSELPGFYASVGFGVPFSCANGIFRNCHAANNSGSGDVSAGFRIVASNDIVLENCIAQQNTNTAGGGGEAWGFTTDTNVGNPTAFGTPVNNRYVFNHCIAENNQATNAGFGGFKFISQVNSILSNSVSSGNGFGILVGDPVCCPIECDDPGSVCVSTNNIINNNQVLGNSLVGILDSKTTANNAYYANFARSNGPAGNNNYFGLPLGTPIRVWILPGAPAPLDSNGILDPQLDNMDVAP